MVFHRVRISVIDSNVWKDSDDSVVWQSESHRQWNERPECCRENEQILRSVNLSKHYWLRKQGCLVELPSWSPTSIIQPKAVFVFWMSQENTGMKDYLALLLFNKLGTVTQLCQWLMWKLLWQGIDKIVETKQWNGVYQVLPFSYKMPQSHEHCSEIEKTFFLYAVMRWHNCFYIDRSYLDKFWVALLIFFILDVSKTTSWWAEEWEVQGLYPDPEYSLLLLSI